MKTVEETDEAEAWRFLGKYRSHYKKIQGNKPLTFVAQVHLFFHILFSTFNLRWEANGKWKRMSTEPKSRVSLNTLFLVVVLGFN